MDFLWDKITEWLKEMLIGGIVSNLSGMFDATNQKVAEISGQVGLSPQAWNGSIFSMIQNLSETVIVPIAGAILAFVMTLELIQLITDKNNLNDMDTWIFFKWAFKSAAAVLIVTNTWTIVMGVFDAAQSVVASASGLIIGDTSINISSVMVGIEDRLMEMELGPLFGLWFQSLFVGITMWALVVMIPAMLFAMYEKNGQPLEVVIRNIYRVCFQRPKQRPYKTNNFYAVLERQNQLDREVYQIVRKEKADPRRTKTDRSRHRKSEPNG